jgi:hypothetical protein
MAREGPHLVVLGVVGHLGQAECLEEWRHVHAEPAAEPLLESVPAADRVRFGPAPGFHRAVRRRFLLVGAAEGHPVAVRLEHRVQVIDGPGVVEELGPADLADDHRRRRRVVAIHRVLGRARRGLESPRVFLGAGAGRHSDRLLIP